jgi:ABC-type transport system involved in multi-copper enzyme maturation permease subunit
MAAWAKAVGALVACLLLLGVAVRAATAISGERDRQTLDNLLTTPLSSTAILAGKWLGSVSSIGWGGLWLGSIWGISIACGGLDRVSLPLLLLAWIVYASLLATVGLWFSLVCRNSLHATLWTLFGTLAIGVGLLLVPLEVLLFSPGAINPAVEWLTRLQLGLTPPVVLGRLLAFTREDLQFFGRKEPWEVQFALLGLLIWSVAAAVLWAVTCSRFRGATGRRPVRPPLSAPQPSARPGLRVAHPPIETM